MTDFLNKNVEQEQLNERILVEQITMLFKSMKPILFINLLVSSVLAYALWDVTAHSTIIAWMTSMLMMLLIRTTIYYKFNQDLTARTVHMVSRFLTIGSGVAGLTWGIGCYFMLPLDNIEYQLFILFAMGSGSSSSLYIYLPAFFAFLPVMLLPVAIKLMIIGGNIPLAIGIGSIIYTFVISIFNITLNRNLKESLSLRFENISLVEKLKQQKLEAEKANISKSKFLAAASHDLRQPLYALGLFTSVLNEKVDDVELQKIVEQISVSSESMKNMFNALLNVSKLDAGAMVTKTSNFLLQP